MADVESNKNGQEETEDFASLEYEEDCFYANVSSTNTPSFDVDDTVWEEENDSLFVLVDEDEFEPPSLTDIPENCMVETEFYDRKLGKNKFVKAVRVKFQDLSKPYLAKVTSQKNYTKFLQLVNGETPRSDMSPDSGINELAGLSPEEQEKQKQEWAAELAKIEEEINAMRQVLNNKIKCSQELKRKLGFSVWREFQDDMSQGLRNVKESNIVQSVEETVGQIGKAVTEVPLYQSVEEKVGQISKAVVEAPLYQKTESVIKATTEKTSSILGGIGSGITSKLGQLKNSESFKSFEEKVGSAYENVKTKVSTSRSSSMQSFDEALRETERKSMTPATTPTIAE